MDPISFAAGFCAGVAAVYAATWAIARALHLKLPEALERTAHDH